MNDLLVSVIVPTRNSSEHLEACLRSIKEQTYSSVELIVVDNASTDTTKEIAKKYADLVLDKGPERSAQRNSGAQHSKGEYVVFIDSDMELTPTVIEDCVQEMKKDTKVKGLVIPEESFGEGFWAACKRLERSFYVGVEWMEAARFFDKEAFDEVGGYNVDMISGEDWDLSQRVAKIGTLSRVDSYIRHNEGRLQLWRTLKKKYYYAQKFAVYQKQNKTEENVSSQTGVGQRYALFFKKPEVLFRKPLLGFGMLFMKTCEFGAGGFGLIKAKF